MLGKEFSGKVVLGEEVSDTCGKKGMGDEQETGRGPQWRGNEKKASWDMYDIMMKPSPQRANRKLLWNCWNDAGEQASCRPLRRAGLGQGGHHSQEIRPSRKRTGIVSSSLGWQLEGLTAWVALFLDSPGSLVPQLQFQLQAAKQGKVSHLPRALHGPP